MISCNYSASVTGRKTIPKLRDLTWKMRFDPPSVLTAFCITIWYQEKWHLKEPLKIGEAIKIIVNILATAKTVKKIDTMSLSPRNLLPYSDVLPSHWYRPYAITAHEYGLLENLTDMHRNKRELKWFTAITPQQYILLLKRWLELEKKPHNLEIFTAYIQTRSKTISREEAANLVMKAFPEALWEWKYIIGQNITFFQWLLQQLRGKTQEQQRAYLLSTLEGLRKMDKNEIGETFNIDIEVIIELLEKVTGTATK